MNHFIWFLAKKVVSLYIGFITKLPFENAVKIDTCGECISPFIASKSPFSNQIFSLEASLWKPITGYQGYYEISNLGVVRGVDRVITLANGNTRLIKGRLIAVKCNSDGYLFVTLSKDGVTKTAYLHRLVAIHFIPNPYNYPQVNHLVSKDVNTYNTLEWTDASGNALHAYQNNLNNHKGSNHTFAVSVRDNELGEEYATIKDWCIARGINYHTGRNILSGCNNSKTVDKTKIIKLKPLEHEKTNSA